MLLLTSHQLVHDESSQNFLEHKKVEFESEALRMDLRWMAMSDGTVKVPTIDTKIEKLPKRGLLGPAATAEFTLEEGQTVYFILRQAPDVPQDHAMNREWIEKQIKRAEMQGVLKDRINTAMQLLRPPEDPMVTRVSRAHTYIRGVRLTLSRNSSRSSSVKQTSTGTTGSPSASIAVAGERTCAALPSCSKCSSTSLRARSSPRPRSLCPSTLAEQGTGRPYFWLHTESLTPNRDYRFTWVRDTSFTLYAFIRLGFTDEARNYVNFILERLKDRNSDGSLQM